jgi:SAM-dependent methyltransferase
MRCNYCNVLFLGQRPAWRGSAEAASDRAEDLGDVDAVHAAGGTAPQIVVAFGSGSGRELEAWCSRYPQARLIGLDRDPNCMNELAARGIEAVQARMEDAATACASLVGQCDVVVCIDALDEADDPRAALQAARALLKTGGFLVVRGIDAGGAQERRFRDGAWHAYAAPMRAYYYNPFNLARLVGSEGFEKVAVDSLPDARGWIRSWRTALALRGADAGVLAWFREDQPLLRWWYTLKDRRAARHGARTTRMRLVSRARAEDQRVEGNAFAPKAAPKPAR